MGSACIGQNGNSGSGHRLIALKLAVEKFGQLVTARRFWKSDHSRWGQLHLGSIGIVHFDVK
jgi:hypothetical protein